MRNEIAQLADALLDDVERVAERHVARVRDSVPTAVVSGATIVAPGTPVSVQVWGGGPVVWQYTNSHYGDGLTPIATAGGEGFNTGIVPFYTHTIGWNVQTGQIVISPK